MHTAKKKAMITSPTTSETIWSENAAGEIELAVGLGIALVEGLVGSDLGEDVVVEDELPHDKIVGLVLVVGWPVEVRLELVPGSKPVIVEVGLAAGRSKKPFFAVGEVA